MASITESKEGSFSVVLAQCLCKHRVNTRHYYLTLKCPPSSCVVVPIVSESFLLNANCFICHLIIRSDWDTSEDDIAVYFHLQPRPCCDIVFTSYKVSLFLLHHTATWPLDLATWLHRISSHNNDTVVACGFFV